MKNNKNIKKNNNNVKSTNNMDLFGIYSINNYNYLENFISFNKFNKKWNELFEFTIGYLKKNNYSTSVINWIKFINSNKNIIILVFALGSLFYSNLLLSFTYYFMLIDSIVLSLLILQNNCVGKNSRRLCKNVILILLTSLNIIGGIFTLLFVIFIYMEYSKFINRIIFKCLKFLIITIGYVLPPIFLLYPEIKKFNFTDPDMTIDDNSHFKLETKLQTDSESNSDPNHIVYKIKQNKSKPVHNHKHKKKYIPLVYSSSDTNSDSSSNDTQTISDSTFRLNSNSSYYSNFDSECESSTNSNFKFKNKPKTKSKIKLNRRKKITI
jgi:hypothetical protein